MDTLSLGTPAWPNRSTMCDSTPHVMGLTKPSGGGGVNDELIFSNCETKEVGSFGIQLPITSVKQSKATKSKYDNARLKRETFCVGNKNEGGCQLFSSPRRAKRRAN